MKRKRKALLCSIIASAAIISAASCGAIMSYAEDTTAASTSAVYDTVESGWVKDENGRFFYYNESGEALTGIQEIDGQKYYFAENGVLKTGWRTIDEKRYYFDPQTGKAVYGWIEYGGNNFYTTAESGKLTGYFADSDGSCYIFDENGVMITDENFIEIDNTFYCAGADGKLLVGEQIIDGVPYIFGQSGKLKTGWRTYDGKRYYYNPQTGKRELGLIKYMGELYYITAENGKCTGATVINGVDYLFDSNYGNMKLGWQTINNIKHYYYADGTAAIGLQTIDGGKYYFAADGKMTTGWQTVGGVKYYFAADGKMATGWQTIGEAKYYFNANGQVVTGLQTIGGSKYYFDADGKMTMGWQTIGSAKYYFSADGVMLTGFQTIGSAKYYFSADGAMLTGWQTINSISYYFDATTGAMAVNTTIDGYTIGADGAASKVSEIQKRANEVIASIGTDAQNVFSYVRSHNKYKFIEATKTLQQIESIGWSYFANYSLDNRFVVCYYFAAVTDVLFKQAGYETRIVYGTGRGSGDHYWNQIKVNGVWTNYDTCNGYSNVTDDFLKSQNYTWYQYVYPVYN